MGDLITLPVKACTILGMGQSACGHKEIIGEAWSLNSAYDFFGGLKFGRYFELHDLAYARAFKAPSGHDHFTRLDMLGCPVYMREHVPEVKESIRFPVEDIMGHFATNYFLGSASYLLAFALWLGMRRIRVYGVDTQDDQHRQQRQSWAYWYRIAIDCGAHIDGPAWWLNEPEQDQGLQGWREAAWTRVMAARATEKQTTQMEAKK